MYYKVLIGSRISSKNLGYFRICFSIEIKIKLKSTLFTFALLRSLFDLKIAIEISTQAFHKITFNSIILARRPIKFLDRNVLYVSKVLAFSDYILSMAKVWEKIKSKKA